MKPKFLPFYIQPGATSFSNHLEGHPMFSSFRGMFKFCKLKFFPTIFLFKGLSLCSCCPPKSDLLGTAKAPTDLSDFNFNSLRNFPPKSQEHSAIFMTSLQSLPRFHLAPISVQSALSSQMKRFDKLSDTTTSSNVTTAAPGEKDSPEHQAKKPKSSPI